MSVLSSKSALLAAAACALVAGHSAIGAPGIPVFSSPDYINSIEAAVAGGDSTLVGGNMGGEGAAKAIDGNLASKYLNFGINDFTRGIDTGFYITPVYGASMIGGVAFATANDNPGRDPLTITIEGSNATTDLTLRANWTMIYSGPSGLLTDPNRQTWGPMQTFANSASYTSYRVLVTERRALLADENSVQYSEAQVYVVPEPAAGLTLLAGSMLGLVRRRKTA